MGGKGGGRGLVHLISACWLASWKTGILAAVQLYKQSVSEKSNR